MSVGVHARSTLISSIFTRSLKMGGKNRSPGKLLNHASTDCSRVDFAYQWGTLAITSPFAAALCLALLIQQIQYSALVGFALLVVAMPIQGWAMKTIVHDSSTVDDLDRQAKQAHQRDSHFHQSGQVICTGEQVPREALLSAHE